MTCDSYPDAYDGIAYIIEADDFSVCQWKNGKGTGGALLTYSLPCTAKRIDIEYVVHLPDGSTSEKITLTSFEVNALLGLEPRKPKKSLEAAGGK